MHAVFTKVLIISGRGKLEAQNSSIWQGGITGVL